MADDFNLTSATASSPTTVDLVFDLPPDIDAVTLDPTSYSIAENLVVTGVSVVDSLTLRLYTDVMHAGVTYQVTIQVTLHNGGSGDLIGKVALFSGVSAEPLFLVSDLTARTDCRGRRVYLSWTTPDSGGPATFIYILRRTRSYPFDVTDPADVVFYDELPPGASSFEDTGVTAAYTTLVSAAAVGDTVLNVVSSVGFEVNQRVRVENLNADAFEYDIATVAVVGLGVIVLASPLTHAYDPTDDAAQIRVGHSAELQDQTFYYYLVVAQNASGDYDITDASRVWGLSIERMNSKDGFFWKNATDYDREKDALALEEGGGDGFLDKTFGVMGCWLNLMRGWANAVKTMNNPDLAPIHTLPAKNRGLGIEPEGDSYDFSVLRRTLMSLVFVYKRKGSCPGIVEAVRMFTLWDADCISFGHGEGGPSPFKTWNGVAGADYGTLDVTSTVGPENRVLTDSTKTWDASLWKDGLVQGWIGDIAIVVDNDDQSLTLAPVTAVTTVDAGGVVVDGDANKVFVKNTVGLYPHMTVQLEQVGDTTKAEICEIATIQPGVSFVTKVALLHTYVEDDLVAIGKSHVRAEYVTTTSTTHAGQVITDPLARWPINCWTGYKLLDGNNVKHDIVSNTMTTVTVDGAEPPDGQAAIAYDFRLFGDWASRQATLRYKVTNGDHYLLFEPTLDIETRGTFYDPFDYMWQGPGSSILGAWGSGDLGVYILTQVCVTLGKASTALLNVLDLDASVLAPSVNEWVGMYLNPNQNQERLFKIVANDATTVTVASSIASLVVPGQVYYVLKPRDAAKFRRISKRLKDEFGHSDINPHVLFA